MRIYERYFARQIYLAFIFILFAFSGLFFFFDLINELNTVGHGNYKFALAVLRVALQTPSRFYEIIPVAALISAIYVFAQMAAASEFTIFRVSGLSTGGALRSLLKIGIPIVLITYIIGEVVGPYSDQLSRARAAGGAGVVGVVEFPVGRVGEGHAHRAGQRRAGHALRQRRHAESRHDHRQRAHLRIRFEVPAAERAHREERRVRSRRATGSSRASPTRN